jgi:hypothetical protein
MNERQQHWPFVTALAVLLSLTSLNIVFLILNIKGAFMERNISLPYMLSSEGIPSIPGDLFIALYRAISIIPQPCVFQSA